MSFWLKQNAIADLKLEHLAMRPHLSQELEPGNDSIVQVDEFCLGQPIDVDLHVHSTYPPLSFLEPGVFMRYDLKE